MSPSRKVTAPGATRVAVGILASRVLGLVREALMARFLGSSAQADVWANAIRGPNILQNLIGEQTLSAAFIPVYSRFVEAGRREDAQRLAGAVFALLLAVAGAVALCGFLFAEAIVSVLASGFLVDARKVAEGVSTVDRFPLAVQAVRYTFPMMAFLVLSSWALSILASHRRFFVAYLAPVFWNLSIIAALLFAGRRWNGEGGSFLEQFVLAACGGALVGGALQFAVQLPWVFRQLGTWRLGWSRRARGLREVLTAVTPLLTARGAIQISGYVEQWLATFAVAAASGLGYAQRLYWLPLSLFGMAVAASELPELARLTSPEGQAEAQRRTARSLRQAAFLAIPATVGLVLLGRPIVGLIYGGGEFGAGDQWQVYLVLVAYALGLPAATLTRQVNNVFFAVGKTQAPAKVAIQRILLAAAVGAPLMFWLDEVTVGDWFSGVSSPLTLAPVGLALGGAVAAWFEWVRMVGKLRHHWPEFRVPWRSVGGITGAALCVAVPTALLWWWLPPLGRMLSAIVLIVAYATSYFALTRWFGVSELGAWLRDKRPATRNE